MDKQSSSYPRASYAWYVVALLTLAYVFSFIDRQILNLMVGPIQADLGINEKQMSLLMGLSFALFYTFFGIPLGRLADTWNRRWIIVIGITFWSIMTAGCGLARKFWHLALMRMGVGVGEASLSPAAYSLIADYFPPHKRSTALGVYGMGIYIGTGLAFVLGGVVVQFASQSAEVVLPLVGSVRSWQMVFFIVGIPGVLMALLLLTIREPIRRTDSGEKAEQSSSLREVWQFMLDHKGTFNCLFLGTALVTLAAYGTVSWVPTFYIRNFEWSARDAGVVFGLIVGVFGTLGIVLAGRAADWLIHRGYRDGHLRIALFSMIAWLPFGIIYPILPSGMWSAITLAPSIFFSSMPVGLAPAAIAQLMPNQMRAQASALYLFVINLIGMGLGPTVVAVFTEDVFQSKTAIHYSLLVTGTVSTVIAIVFFAVGMKKYQQSMRQVKG